MGVVSTTGSIVSINQGSIAAVIIGGSIAASFTPPANQSVSGTVGASIIGLIPVTVTTTDIFPATQNVTVVDSSSSTATGANGQSIVIGTPTAGSAATFTTSGVSTIRVEVTGIWTGTLTSEQSIDGGTTWTTQGLHQGAYTTSSFTAGFIGGGNVAGATNYRIRATAAITGTAVVRVVQSVNEQSMYIANAAPAGTVISLLNSTTATLGIGATYTGTGEDVSNFSEMRISVFSDQASGTDGLSIQQSTNNTNWDIIDTYTIPASTGKTFVVPRQARYYRIVYTNGGTGQGSFRLQSILNRTATAPSSNRASDGYTNETDLVQNQTFGMVYNGSTWDRMRGTTSGTLVTGSVQQGTSPWIITGSVQASITPSANQSVSGTVGASIIGLPPFVLGGSTNASVITVGSPVANQSVSGTVGASIIGTVPVTQATNPWTVVSSIAGGIFPISGSVAAVVTNFPTTQNVSGSVVAFQAGTNITSISGQVTVVSSLTGGIFPISGSVAAVVTNFPTNQNVSGSVVAFQGGTQITSISGTVTIASIVATYAEDSASTDGQAGLFVLGVRNDTIASLVSADKDYGAFTTDSAGRTLMRPFAAEEARVEGYNSVVSTSVTTLIPISAAGIRNYVTDLWFINTGATTAGIVLQDGLGSVLGYAIAPAGGGWNLPGLATPIRTGTGTSFDFKPLTASSILYGTAKGYKAP